MNNYAQKNTEENKQRKEQFLWTLTGLLSLQKSNKSEVIELKLIEAALTVWREKYPKWRNLFSKACLEEIDLYHVNNNMSTLWWRLDDGNRLVMAGGHYGQLKLLMGTLGSYMQSHEWVTYAGFKVEEYPTKSDWIAWMLEASQTALDKLVKWANAQQSKHAF